MALPRFYTLVELLQYRVAEQPDLPAFTFLDETDGSPERLSYSELDRQARAIAAQLQEHCKPGDRALLLYPAGLEYIAAFWGCLYAGVVAVPSYPPRASRAAASVHAIAADAQAKVALTASYDARTPGKRIGENRELAALKWLAPVPTDERQAGQWRTPSLRQDSLAFLQYTSGSTRTPHGVMVSHDRLLHNLALTSHGIPTTPDEVCVSWAPLYHDMGLIWGILQPVFLGLPLVLMAPTTFAARPVSWLEAITRFRGTYSGAPNFAYQLCVDKITPEDRAGLDLSSWKLAFCGAEPIRAKTLASFAATFAPHGFHASSYFPSYGLAESTLVVTRNRQPAEPRHCTVARTAIAHHQVREVDVGTEGAVTFVGCGRPLLDQRIAIVDPETQMPCSPDRVGEIWVSGPSVTLGYWQRAAATQQTFHAYLGGSGEGPFLRTGDLGFVKDGELFVTGRLKDLIIIRGRNYYPQDIEQVAEYSHAALQPHGGAAFAVDDSGEDQLVVVHELKRSQRAADPSAVAGAVRRAIAEELELAAHTIVLLRPGALPRTTSGKPQRALCRSRFLAGELDVVAVLPRAASPAGAPGKGPGPELPTAGTAPMTVTEQRLADIWSEVIACPALDAQSDFFALGGDSLIATQIVARIRERFQVELPLRMLFESPTIGELAAAIDGMAHDSNIARLADGGAMDDAALPGAPLPLSPAQERMWFAHQIQPDSVAYSIPVAVRLAGTLDVPSLERSVDALVARHGSLRSTFRVVDGQPVQIVAAPQLRLLPVFDLRHLPVDERVEAARRMAEEEARCPFDLDRGPLFRVMLLIMGDDDHVIVVNMQHTIGDAWSYGVLVRELSALYAEAIAGRPVRLAAPAVQYADFVHWQRTWLQDGVLEDQLHYWRAKLASAPILEIPTDHPRPAAATHRGAHREVKLSPALHRALHDVSRREDVTLFMTLLAAFDLLLYRYTGQDDIVVGAPIANRRWLAVEGVIGTFVNTLALRTQLAGDLTFRDLLRQVREVALDAFAHQDVPLDRLIAELRPERTSSHPPLVQVLFNVTNVPMPALVIGGVTGTRFELDRRAAQFDLNLTVSPEGDTQLVALEYNTDLFEETTIARMLGHFQTVLETIACGELDRTLDEFRLLTGAEWQRQVVAWNATARDYPKGPGIHQLFEVQAAQTPDAIAVTGPAFDSGTETSLTYGELNQRANRLAHHLQGLGVGPEVCVAISIERSPAMLVGLLGILKAGGAYLPLDPTFPGDRLAYMLADARAPFLLTQARLLSELPAFGGRVICIDTEWPEIAANAAANLDVHISPGQLAYLLYTSGSTGRPKGVQIPHRALTNFLCSMAREPGIRRSDILLAVTTLSFDISGLELFLPLIAGAQVVLASRQEAADGARLAQKLRTSGATIMQATPVTWRLLLESGWKGEPRLRILCGGEALPRDLADSLLARSAGVWNLYGPTETTIWSTLQHVTADAPITIGRPIANTQLYILNAKLEPAPIGIAGDLYIGGDGLARGYLNQPALTAERFVPNPFDLHAGARMYKTGDRARYLADGSVEFLGRLDHQVKVRGFRIELAEIEAVLRGHPAVQEAVVVAREERPGDRRLVAYIVARSDRDVALGDLRATAKAHLPDYMVPAHFVLLDTLPLTPNNKVDRNALPAPHLVPVGDTTRPSRTQVERQLVTIWETLLDTRPIGITDDFFDLGGHSLLGVRMMARIEETFGVNLPLSSLFPSATVERLAQLVEEQGRSARWPSLVALQPEGARPPFYCVHGITGDVLWFRELARALAPDQPFFGIQARGLDGVQPPHERIEPMAAQYVAEIRAFQPHGPYTLGGASFGGVVALEMSRQLLAQGEQVALLAMFDHAPPDVPDGSAWAAATGVRRLLDFVVNLPFWLYDLGNYTPRQFYARARRKLGVARKRGMGSLRRIGVLAEEIDAADLIDYATELPPHRHRLIEAHYAALTHFQPSHYPGSVVLFRARTQPFFPPPDPARGWQRIATGGLDVRVIPGSHEAMFALPNAAVLARELDAYLRDVQAPAPLA